MTRTDIEAVVIANRIEAVAHVIHCIADQAEDEGDRIYFGSTNDPHSLVRQATQLLAAAETIRNHLKAIQEDQPC